MIYLFSKGKNELIDNVNDGSRDNPWYWNIVSKNNIANVNNSHISGDNGRLYFRVKLKNGVEYQIGQTSPGGGDGTIWIYDENYNELDYNDDSRTTINGVACSDHLYYTPDEDGIYIIGAGAWSSSRGNYQVTVSPSPEYDESPYAKVVYFTSSGFNQLGKALGYRSVSVAGCGIAQIPTEGLVFCDKFATADSVAETGQGYEIEGNIKYSVVDGVSCATFDGSQGLYTSGEGIISGKDPRTFVFKFRLNDSSSRPEYGYCVIGLGDGSSGVGSHYELCIVPTDNDTFGFDLACWDRDTEDYFNDFQFVRNKWYVVALTYDGNNVEKFYVDGKYIAERSHTGLDTANDELAIGEGPGWGRGEGGFE